MPDRTPAWARVMRSGALVGLGTAAWRVGNFVSLFLLARGVGTAPAGGAPSGAAVIPLIATAMAYSTIANLAVGTFVGRYLLRRRRGAGVRSHLSALVAVATAGTAASAVVLAELCRRTIDLPFGNGVAAWAVCVVAIGGFAVADAAITILNVVGEHRRAAGIQVVFGGLSLAVCATVRGWPGETVVLAYLVVPVLLGAVAAQRLRGLLVASGPPGPPPTLAAMRRVAGSLFTFTAPLLISNACINPLVVYGLSSLDGPVATRAAYLVAYTWMGACAAIPGFLNTSSQALVFSRGGAGRGELLGPMLGLNVGIAAAAVALVALLSATVLRQYGALGPEMGTVLLPFVAAAVPFAAFQAIATQILAIGRARPMLYANLAFAVALIPMLRLAAGGAGPALVGPGFLAAHLVRTAVLAGFAWRAGLFAARPAAPAPAMREAVPHG